jgi:hypothetical protein
MLDLIARLRLPFHDLTILSVESWPGLDGLGEQVVYH